MKIKLLFKNPEAVPEALNELSEEDLLEYQEVEKAIKKFVKWKEFVEIEIDSETMTARVLEVE